MLKFINVLKAEGEEAVRKSIWLVAACLLSTLAAGFLAASLAYALATVMPAPLAILAGASFLFLTAFVCMLIARQEEASSPPARAPAEPSLLDQSALKLVQDNLLSSPGKTMLAGIVAGAALGALDAFENRRR